MLHYTYLSIGNDGRAELPVDQLTNRSPLLSSDTDSHKLGSHLEMMDVQNDSSISQRTVVNYCHLMVEQFKS